MEGIYYKDGIYVLIDNDNENNICIYHYNYRDDVSLYAGRIKIKYRDKETAYLLIDGISIIRIEGKSVYNNLSLSGIVSYLNAIEANGVDAFLDHYKKSIEFLYEELKEMNQKIESQLSLEQEDSKINDFLSELQKVRNLLFSVLAILFNLYTYMSAGLENEKVRSVYQSIIDSLS